MDYGIANTTGQPVYNTARSIVQEAWESGICEFDTAQAYGQSERVLGRVFKDLGIADEVRVITKFAPDVDHSDRAALNNALEISLNNLGVESLYGLMLHREDMLDLWEKGLEENLMNIVGSGRVKHIGVSVYLPEKAVQALNTEGISMVQLPTNIIDRRFKRAGVFELADDVGKAIYIRSIFLQGLLLMPPDAMPEHMRFAAPVLNRLVSLAQDIGLNIMELCMVYVKHAFPRARLVFGAETPEQIRENLKCWNVAWSEELTQKVQIEFENIDEMIFNPSLWPKGFANAQRISEVQ
jgi:aryl-alcohol dehydrogenase-like predicted oxidoreductase